jgi:hypothetical protein
MIVKRENKNKSETKKHHLGGLLELVLLSFLAFSSGLIGADSDPCS